MNILATASRIAFRGRLFLLSTLLLTVNVSSTASLVWGAGGLPVAFDAPAVTVAQEVDSALVDAPTTGGQLMRLRIPVSTYVNPEFRGVVTEYAVELESTYQTLRVIDFWPKSEVYTSVEGNVAVETTRQQDSKLGFNVSAAYEPIGRATGQGDFAHKDSTKESFQRKPPMQVLSSSGTIRRGYGVFFKFRPGPLPVLEGVREIAILVEVPPGWRADMLQVSMQAMGTEQAGSSRIHSLGHTRMWMTTHREGDWAAAAQAKRYVTQERSLRSLAAASQSQVQEKSLPTMWHKMGAALDMVQPRIPEDYLTQVIFGARNRYRDNPATNRLPVDLRVAVLDYWDQREQLVQLAFPKAYGSPAYGDQVAISHRAASDMVAAQ